jgi:hypothetical protein
MTKEQYNKLKEYIEAMILDLSLDGGLYERSNREQVEKEFDKLMGFEK